ncbi:MAG: Fe(3+) ABC transporter substrate-binding protein [Planctomycetota bacterium]
MKFLSPVRFAFALLCLLGIFVPASAQESVVNLYTSRHYDTDEVLYKQFTEDTGIAVNVIEGKADELIARLKREGELSPADVFIAVDAGRLHKAVEQGVLQPVESSVLSERIPANLRQPEGLWFGLSKRFRIILLAPGMPSDFVSTYEELAEDKIDGGLLIRSSSNIYNQSLLASLIEYHGEEAVVQWAQGVVGNMARAPQGGDTDQIRALAAGEGELAVANHYYLARLMASSKKTDRKVAEGLQVVFPNQDGRGAHVNISGAGVVKGAPNRDNAVRFLEYLTTANAQKQFAVANHEFPVVEGVELSEVLKTFGDFKGDEINAAKLGEGNRDAVKVMDRAGWR